MSVLPCNFSSIMCFRRQFLRWMWPIQLAVRYVQNLIENRKETWLPGRRSNGWKNKLKMDSTWNVEVWAESNQLRRGSSSRLLLWEMWRNFEFYKCAENVFTRCTPVGLWKGNYLFIILVLPFGSFCLSTVSPIPTDVGAVPYVSWS